jgi:hypothetical protein
MRRLLLALSLLSPYAWCQGNAVVLTNTGAPTGGCAFVMFYINKSDNTLYDCNSGSWHLVGPGAAGSATWNSLADPTGNQVLTMAHFTSTWTYDALTGANVNTFVVRDTLNNTGTGHIFLVNSASGSAAKPIGFFAGGTSNGVEMSTTGVLAKAGTGAINANQFNGNTIIASADGGNGVANTGAAGKVPIGDGAGHFVEGDPLVQGVTAHDAVGSATNPVAIGGFASAAAPTSVSADGDIVNGWFLRNGAQAMVVTAAGALIGGDAANGLDVDVTRVGGNVATTVADGANTTLGAKGDAKSTATDTTAITIMQVLKEISFMEQTPASRAVTNAGTFAVQSTNQAASAGTNIGSVTPQPSTSSSDVTTDCVILSAASTNSTNCKGSAGNFYGYEIYNTTTTVYYLRLYNASGTPTCSSATGFIRSIPVPPAAAAGGVGGAVSYPIYGVNYATGIAFCLTGGSSSTDNTNAAVGIFGVIKYK